MRLLPLLSLLVPSLAQPLVAPQGATSRAPVPPSSPPVAPVSVGGQVPRGAMILGESQTAPPGYSWTGETVFAKGAGWSTKALLRGVSYPAGQRGSNLVGLQDGLSMSPFLLDRSGASLGITAPSLTLIDFNGFPLHTTISSQYAPFGVLFSSSTVNLPTIEDVRLDAQQEGDCCPVNPPTPLSTPPYGLRIVGPAPYDDVLVIRFVHPFHPTKPGFVRHFRYTFIADEAGIGRLEALDFNHRLVATAVSTHGGIRNDGLQELETLEVAGPELWEVHIRGFADVVIDDVAFDGPFFFRIRR